MHLSKKFLFLFFPTDRRILNVIEKMSVFIHVEYNKHMFLFMRSSNYYLLLIAENLMFRNTFYTQTIIVSSD